MNKINTLMVLLILLFSTYLNAGNLSIKHINNIGKNLKSQVGFYVTCSNKKIISLNDASARWASFSGGKYLSLTFTNPEDHVKELENLETTWYKKGTEGILFYDPSNSNKTMKVDFNKKYCEYVKTVLDTNFNLMKSYVFKK